MAGRSPSSKCLCRLFLAVVSSAVFWPGTPVDGAEQSKAPDAAEKPKPAGAAEKPKPTGGAEKPKPANGAEKPKPANGAEKPKPADGAEKPKPADGIVKKHAERKLQFQFRFQRWADVLEWLAEQADLSLVINAPPPGTLNYSDSREYTPTEAIDLLNGVLLTKGYTLIRRERMLLVVNLQDGIPAGLVPRITLKDLDKRGNFELVSVLFPLDGRDPQAVNSEITPLLGPHGKSVPLPQTKQILVTDTAGIMRVIDALIQSMSKPKPKPSKPEKPVLQVHQVKSVDPQSVIDVVTLLLPEIKLVLDPKTKQINAYATPSQHTVLKSVIEQMEAGNAPDKRARLELYPLDEKDTAELMATLAVVVPSAQLRIDGKTGKLVAWATAAEHEKLQATLKKLERGTSVERTRQLEVYRLSRAEPNSTLTLLQNLLPDAKLAVDSQTRSLIAVAVPADQKAIKAMLEQLQAEAPAGGQSRFESYPLYGANSSELLTSLQPLMPNARLSVDTTGRKLIAWGTPAEHAQLKTVLEKLRQDDSPQNTRQIEVYQLTKADPDTTLSLLQKLLPNVQLTVDAKARKLIAVAVPADQKAIQAMLEQLQAKAPAGEQPRFESYPLYGADSSELLTSLQPLVPNARLSIDTTGTKLIAWGTPAEHAQLKTVLEKLAEGHSPENTRQVDVYPLTRADPDTTLSLLQKLLPKAQLTIDVKTRKLIAVAIPADQKAIQAMLEQLQAKAPAGEQPRFESYPLYGANSSEIVTSLQPLVPNARLSVDTTGTKLIAWGTPAEHAQLKAVLEKLGQGNSPENTRQIEVHRLTKADPDTTLTLLKKLLPNAQLTVDPKTHKLIAVAVPADQKAIQAMLEQLQAEAPVGEQPRFESYPLYGANSSEIVTSLQPLVPNARLSVDTTGTKLIVWATPAEHAQLKAVLEKLRQGASLENTRQIEVYALTKVDPDTTLTLLKKLLPNAQLTVDPKTHKLIAVAVPADQKAIKAMVEQLQGAGPASEQPRFESYPLHGANSSEIVTSLQPLVPNARLSVDTTGRKLIAWGTPAEHVQLQTVLEKLGQGDSPANTRQIEVYHLTKVDPDTTLTLLQNLLPRAQLSVDTQTRKLVAVAVPADQRVIKTTLEQLQPDKPGPDAPELRSYSFSRALASSVTTALSGLVPNAQVTADAQGKRLLVVASPSDHAVVKEAIEQIEKTLSAGEHNQLVVYPVTPAQRTRFEAVMSTLTTELPGIKVVTDAEPGELAVWAKPSQHKIVAEIIDELKRDVPKEQKYQLTAYTIKTADLDSVRTVLETLFPNTKIVADEKTDRLLIWTSPAEHATIKSTIEQLDSEKSAERRESFMVYPVPKADPQVAIEMLQQLLPDAKFVNDAKAGTIAAWAKKADHELIAQTLEKMQAGAGLSAAKVVVYDLEITGAAGAADVLASAFPKMRFSYGSDGKKLIAWGTPADHEIVKKIVDQLEANVLDKARLDLKVYDVRATGAEGAQKVLSTAVPKVKFTTGSDSTKIMAWATPEDHAVIGKLVLQLEKENSRLQERLMRVYPLKESDADAVLDALDPLLKQDAVFVADSVRNSLVVWADAKHHEAIRAAVEQLVKELPPSPEPTSQVYHFRHSDPEAAMGVLSSLVPDAEMAVDAGSRILVVSALPADHAKIKAAVDEIDRDRAEERALEVFQLEFVDPFTAEMAVDHLFGDDTDAANAPLVDSDKTTQRLFVRASKEQLTQIRDLLVKMGEATLTTRRGMDGTDRRLRVIPFEGDVERAIEEIQRVWPQLRKNSLRVLSRPPLMPLQRRPREKDGHSPKQPAAQPKPRQEKPSVKKPQDDEFGANFSVGDAFLHQAKSKNPTAAGGDPAEPDQPATKKKQTKAQSESPVIVVPGDGSVTIASDDSAALDQFEALLRALSRRMGTGNRSYIVFPLQNAGAVNVSDTLKQLFREGGFGVSTGSVVVVPDERLNAVIVHANRADRATVKSLLEVLDSADVPDSLAIKRPTLIPVKNTSAARIEEVIRNVYKTHLTAGAGRRPMSLPSGLPSKLASTWLQMSAASAGPLLTIDVEEKTNSLVVMAPANLLEEITQLVEKLDRAVLENPSRGVTIIPLKKVNSKRLEKALDLIMDDAAGAKRRR